MKTKETTPASIEQSMEIVTIGQSDIITAPVEEAIPMSIVPPSIFISDFSSDEAIAKFIREEDIKPTSLKTYERILKLFFRWVDDTNRDARFLSIADVKEWKDYLFTFANKGKGATSLSVAGYITALRRFYAWLEANKYGMNITRGIKTPRREQKFIKQHLEIEQCKDYLSYFATSRKRKERKTPKHVLLRDYAIVNLLIRCGLRTIEAVRANIGDISYRGGHRIMWIQGKGHDTKDRFVMLTDKAYQPICEYLKTRPNARQSEPLFISDSHRNHGERLTTRTISGICKKGMRAIGLNDLEHSAHSLRHTTAVMILLNGGTSEDAQQVLRHTNPATTQIYTKTIEERRRLEGFAEHYIDKAF